MHKNLYLETAGLDLPEDFQLSQEGLTVNMAQFMSATAQHFRALAKRIKNEGAHIEDANLVSRADFENLFKDHGWSMISKMRCFTISKMNGNVADHLEVLEEQVKALVTIEERLLDPLIEYTAHAASDPSIMTKPWVDKRVSMLDTDGMKKKLTKTFDPSQLNGDVPSESTYRKSFSSTRDVYSSCDQLKSMIEEARQVDLEVLVKKETKLAEYIDEMVDAIDNMEVNKQTVVMLSNAVAATSVELEYVSAVMYYLTANVNALNETFEYTKRIIEA